MKLFVRIFLGFWIATVLMIAVVLGVGEFYPRSFPETHAVGFHPELAEAVLTKAVNAYEEKGTAAFLSLATIDRRSLVLLDQEGSVLVKDGVLPPFYRRLAKNVLQSGQSSLLRPGLRMIYACPIRSSSGRQYAVVLTVFAQKNRLLRPHFWFNLAIAMVPSALVCLILALYITRPIAMLQRTAQRLASGDLDARSSPPRIARRDELGDLSRDFDVMAGQIQLLMTAQRRFVADVSHELGAPLTRMHLALALLRRQFAGKNTAELERIERETDKLSNLVQQLLLLAGMEAGSLPAETLAPVSIRTLCQSIVEDANFEAMHADCRVTSSSPDLTFLAYPQLLRRAIDNVLRNAIRYAPPGSEILLRGEVSPDSKRVTLEILDCGPGVPESMLSDIFRPFFRTSPGRESDTGGTGLGLAIAAEAIRVHEGTIIARNRKERGLGVTITLPLRIPIPDHELQHCADRSST